MFCGFGFGSIAERGENGFAFIPGGELIGIVAAARLARLPRRDEKNGLVPVSRISHKTHRWAVSLHRRSDAIERAGLGLASNAEKCFQQALMAKRVKHVQGIEFLPRPILDTFALALAGESFHGEIGGCSEQLIIAFVCGWKPFRRAIRKSFLKEGSTAPLVEAGIFAQKRLEEQIEGCAPRSVQERDLR